MSTSRYLNVDAMPARPNGHCRNCGQPVPKGRRTRCSTECAEALDLMYSPAIQRHAVWKRDRGVCAICGYDCDKLERIMQHARNATYDLNGPFEMWRGTQNELGFGSGLHLWEMDHIVPVVEGGGVEVGMTAAEILANLRTLCIPCHHDETRKLAGRRAAKRRILETHQRGAA